MLKIFYIIMGVLSLGNGAWMLATPEMWYHDVPAGVPDTGAFNPHFIRDIGLAYAIAGAGFIWAAWNLARCWVVHIGLTLFSTGHAVLHVIDIFVGRLPVDHWLVDAPGVLVPGLIMALLCIPAVWRWANPASGSQG